MSGLHNSYKYDTAVRMITLQQAIHQLEHNQRQYVLTHGLGRVLLSEH